MKLSLYNHQKLALNYLRTHEGFALFMGQGTGKTLPTLMVLLELYEIGEIENALIVCPKSVIEGWRDNIEKGFSRESIKKFDKFLSIINYDVVWKKRLAPVYDIEWGAVVLDEAHAIKNKGTNRSNFLLNLSLKSKYRYILTGTPTGNAKMENLWSLFTFLYPVKYRGVLRSQIFGTWTNFIQRYCITNEWYQPYRYVNINELQDVMDRYSYRVLKEECLELPEKLPDVKYMVDLAEKKKYKEMAKDGTIAELDILAGNSLVRSLKLRTMCSGFILDENKKKYELKNNKIKVLKELIEEWDNKFVIFCNFTSSIDTVSQLLDEMKFKHIILDGRQKDKTIWRRFQEDENIKVIVCQYESASEGINLHAADTIVYYEPTLKTITLEQSRDRIHRIGQTKKCSYYHLLTRGTIEVAIYNSLANFTDFTEKLFTEYIYEYTRSYSK